LGISVQEIGFFAIFGQTDRELNSQSVGKFLSLELKRKFAMGFAQSDLNTGFGGTYVYG
jgi:hypothetical protein